MAAITKTTSVDLAHCDQGHSLLVSLEQWAQEAIVDWNLNIVIQDENKATGPNLLISLEQHLQVCGALSYAKKINNAIKLKSTAPAAFGHADVDSQQCMGNLADQVASSIAGGSIKDPQCPFCGCRHPRAQYRGVQKLIDN